MSARRELDVAEGERLYAAAFAKGEDDESEGVWQSWADEHAPELLRRAREWGEAAELLRREHAVAAWCKLSNATACPTCDLLARIEKGTP